MLKRLFWETNNEPLSALADGRLDGKRGIAVLSHPRSGTHLTIDVLRRNFPVLSPTKPLLAPLDALYVSLDSVVIEAPDTPPVRRAVQGLSNHPMPIIKTHWVDANFDNLSQRSSSLATWFSNNTLKLYIIRNPVKVFPSLLNFEESFGAVGNDRLEWLNKKTVYWANHVKKWSQREDVIIFRFEDLITNPKSLLDLVSMVYSDLTPTARNPMLPAPTSSLLQNRLQRLSRNPPSTEIRSLKTPEKFSAIFSEQERAVFWKNTRETCIRFGYPSGEG